MSENQFEVFDSTFENVERIEEELRKCNTCGAQVGPSRPDACFGTLPGVVEACCGHGDRRKSYIHFDTGLIVRGFTLQKRPNDWGERVS